MQFTTPIPFAEAIAKLAARKVVPSVADSSQWARVSVALRERAFFSSRVESARVLQGMQDYLSDFLQVKRMDNGGLVAQGRAEFVADMRELAIREGLGKVDPVTGRVTPEIRESDLTDIRSIARLQLVFDTQTEAAQEHGYWMQGQDPAILDVFPAQRFIRVRPVKSPRPYHEAALGEIRRKDDLKFWISLNHDFGVPWGPWGYSSGCGVEDVDRDEAIAAGVMKESDTVKPVAKDFNDGLSAGIQDFDSDMLAALRRVTGGTVAKGRLTPPPSKAPPLTKPAAAPASTGFTDLLARLGLDDPKVRVTATAAEGLVNALKQPSPASGRAKISKITGAQRKGTVTRKFITDTMDDLVAFLPPSLVKLLPRINIRVVPSSRSAAGSYGKSTQTLTLAHQALQDPATARKVIFHELIHWTHDHGPQAFRDEIAAFYAARTAGEKAVRLAPFNRHDILGRKDKWLDADGDEYAARIYPWEDPTAPEGLEVVTRHLEKLADPANLAKHWNHTAPDGSFAWREAFTTCAKILFPWP